MKARASLPYHALAALFLLTYRILLAGESGSVFAWGHEDYGKTIPPVSARHGIKSISAGAFHALALTEEGGVIAWGAGTNNTGTFPHYGQSIVPQAALSGVAAVAAGTLHSVVLKEDGSVLAWGYNLYGQTNVPAAAQNDVISIAAGFAHTVALKKDGSVLAWGNNDHGQTNVPVAARTNVIAIAAGRFHTVALKGDGSVLAWGAGVVNTGQPYDYGQSMVPVEAESGVTAIAAGSSHTLALKNGRVLAWGWNSFGQTNVPPEAETDVTAISGGGLHCVALKNDGTVVSWGSIYDGSGYLPATAPQGLSAVSAIAAGGDYTTAIVSVLLRAVRSGGEIVLSWPTNAVEFVLEFTSDTTSPAVWYEITNNVGTENGRSIVTNSLSSGARFYRLVK